LSPSGAFRKASQFVTLDVPGANSIVANGINGAGLIVGIYYDRSGGHGFLAVPEPSAVALFGTGAALLGLGYARRRRAA
jgi:PEP-CTERM motif